MQKMTANFDFLCGAECHRLMPPNDNTLILIFCTAPCGAAWHRMQCEHTIEVCVLSFGSVGRHRVVPCHVLSEHIFTLEWCLSGMHCLKTCNEILGVICCWTISFSQSKEK